MDDMNQFQNFAADIQNRLAGWTDVEFEISEPLRPDGFWIATLHSLDDYVLEVEWNRHRGFGLIAGRDMGFGEGVHEACATPEAAADRVVELWTAKADTNPNLPVSIAELRKLRGHLQKDLATELGITKGGLAQIEASADQGKVQVDTLRKLVASLGGRLVISAAFPDGTERKVAIGR
jgi:DNA-binding XRE family transcriptional regulator